MTILDQTFFGNRITNWLIMVGISIVLYIILELFLKLALKNLERLAKGTNMHLDDLLVAALRQTKTLFIAALSLYIGVRIFDMTDKAQHAARIVMILVFLVQAGLWASAGFSFWLTLSVRQKLDQDASSATTLSALGFLSKAIIWAIILLLGLENLGVNITALVAGLGVGGIAVALAVQSILGDLFASLSIVLDKPFVIGDFITVDSFLGTIEHIGLRTTRIRSLSGEQLVLSNTDLLKSRIRNYKRMLERRIQFAFGVTYETPYERLAAIPGIVRAIIEAASNTRFDRAHFKEYGDSSLNFEVVYYVLDPDYNIYMDTQQVINLGLYKEFDKRHIDFAYPTRTLYVRNVREENHGGKSGT
jgi:small-conductance mechanosensitive channel